MAIKIGKMFVHGKESLLKSNYHPPIRPPNIGSSAIAGENPELCISKQGKAQ